MLEPATSEPFDTLAHQAHAARLGMWLFLASELLLFGGFFALLLAYRVEHARGFAEGVHANTKVMGSTNTLVLIISSSCVATAVHVFREGRRRLAGALVFITVALGAVFLVLKMTEYGMHFHDGIYPGGHGAWFKDHTTPGLSTFWPIYFCAPGLHATPVIAGMTFLSIVGRSVLNGRLPLAHVHRLELAAVYWHLVDVVWIFLWPLFYLA